MLNPLNPEATRRRSCYIAAKYSLIISCCAIIFQVPSSTGLPESLVGTQVTSITQFNITFRFSKAVSAGRYATGDWWVLGPVTVVSLEPNSSQGRNGWQINPSDPTGQALDSRIAAYNESLLPTLPETLSPGSVVVKAKSLPDPIKHSVALYSVAVLTILTNVPNGNGANSLRPPYFGTTETRAAIPNHTVGEIESYIHLLPNLSPLAQAPNSTWLKDRFNRPQIDWLRDWISREIHPTSAMPDYGADILRDAGDAALLLMTNSFGNESRTKSSAAIGFVQWGLDCYGILKAGGTWPANGGHSNGRKIALIFAALLLGDSVMAEAVSHASTCVGSTCSFSEDGEITRSPSHTNETLFGEPSGTEREYWSLLTDKSCDGNRIQADPYGYIDGGPVPGSFYQACCTSMPWQGTALALLLWPSARSLFNDDAFIQYVKRWSTIGAWAAPDPCAPPTGICSDGSAKCTGNCSGSPCGPSGTGHCILSMDGYMKEFGSDGKGGCILDTDPSDGIGRFPYAHGRSRDQGDYGSAFQKNMWLEDVWPIFRTEEKGCFDKG